MAARYDGKLLLIINFDVSEVVTEEAAPPPPPPMLVHARNYTGIDTTHFPHVARRVHRKWFEDFDK
jgi:hypothetical protein